MAEQEDSMNEDQWLYGDSNQGLESEETKEETLAPPGEDPEPQEEVHTNHEEPEANPEDQPADENNEEAKNEEEHTEEKEAEEAPEDKSPKEASDVPDGQTGGEEGEEEEDDDDDSDDDIRVTIGDIKTAHPTQYSSLNIKRGVALSSGIDKLNKQQPGKFSIEEFESIGTINGVPAHEFSIDALEDKPWRKPGADITDYFNYGFNEDTWRAYCERQKQMRIHESGVGLGGLGVSRANTTLTIINDNSKYSAMPVLPGGVPNTSVPPPGVMIPGRKAGPPPIPRRSGVIEVIGGGGIASRRANDSPPKDSPIQVMTSDRRDYGRKSFDMSIPPPGFEGPPSMNPVMASYPPHGYNPDFQNYDVDHYYAGYEPTQDMQWGNNQMRSSRHREKRSSRGTSLNPDHSKRIKSEKYLHGSIIGKEDSVSVKQESEKSFSKDRERERDRSDRHKDRSHRHRTRSRSADRDRRSRKHKSRSRSPSHRSHKKKKSKKSDRKDAGSD